MTHYGILGGGDHPTEVVQDGLKDLFSNAEDHTLYVHCRVGASQSEKRVYDWILDNHTPFNAVVSGKAPSILLESADYIMDGGASVANTIIRELSAVSGTLLVLWDEENASQLSQWIIQASDMGVKVLELSNGLTPIIIDGEPEEKPQLSVETTEVVQVELDPITETELSSMTVSALKKAAFAQGISDAGSMSKEQLVSVLNEPATVSTIPASDLNGALVYNDNGVIRMLPLKPEVVASLLGRG